MLLLLFDNKNASIFCKMLNEDIHTFLGASANTNMYFVYVFVFVSSIWMSEEDILLHKW